MSLQFYESLVVNYMVSGVFCAVIRSRSQLDNFLEVISSWIQAIKGEDVLRLVRVPI